VTGSRNPRWSNLVELEWNSNPERDVTGYQVYRMLSSTANPSTDALVCTTSVGDAAATACQDRSAPAGSPRYYVIAVAPAQSGTGDDHSPASGIVDTGVGDAAPLAPAQLTAQRLTGGGVTLSWPAASDPDGTIRYYRIYRDDNTSYTSRLDRTGSGGDLSWTDNGPNAANHAYWVTAVDDRLAESPFAPSGAGVTAP
jgi:hypothetical protein